MPEWGRARTPSAYNADSGILKDMPGEQGVVRLFRRVTITFKAVRNVCLGVAMLAVASSVQAAQALPGFAEVKAAYSPSDALLLDRHGEPLADVRFDPVSRRVEWVGLDSLSKSMREALLVAEDKRFFEHKGVDWLAVMGAAWQNIWGKTRRGASTLTMQLAGLLDPALRLPGSPGAHRSVTQKWDQGLAAVELEKHWQKAQILEAYLNLAPFRGDLQGIGAASELLFGLPAKSLGYKEASILAALLRGPNARPSIVARRACGVASRLGHKELCGEIARLAHSRLDLPRGARFKLAPHLAHRLLRSKGERFVSTLDAGLQRRLLAALEASWRGSDTAALVLDNATGDVLAWVGGVSGTGEDGVLARRHFPEWSWPHLAALSIEHKQFTAASPLPDVTAVLDSRDAHVAGQWLSLRSALASRQAGCMHYLSGAQGVGLSERLKTLGVESGASAEDAEHVSLIQVAAAWRALASGGVFIKPRFRNAGDEARNNVYRPESAFIVLDILGQTVQGGWSAFWPMPVEGGRELVLVGSTDKLTLALIGPSPSNISVAWRGLLKALGAEASHAPALPDGLVQSLVSFEPALEAPRREWFLRNAESGSPVTYLFGRRARIVGPPVDSMQAMIPGGKNEPLLLEAESGVPVRWRLDGRLIGEGLRVEWLPRVGRHGLSLFGLNDELLDSLEFEVKEPDASEAEALDASKP